MDKKTMRHQMKQVLQSLDKITYEHYSYLIAQNLYSLPIWKNAKVIGVTVSRFPEVDTWQIIRTAWEQKKIVAIPKCLPETKEMDFYQLTQFSELEVVYYNLFEPNPKKTKYVDPNSIDLLIVPGLIYTKKGERIGFGGGYYDRFLQKFKGETVSLAFSNQIVDYIPTEPFDQSVSQIVTEKNYINCKE